MINSEFDWATFITAITPIALAVTALIQAVVTEQKSKARYHETKADLVKTQAVLADTKDDVQQNINTIDKVETALYASSAVNGPYKEKRVRDDRVDDGRRKSDENNK